MALNELRPVAAAVIVRAGRVLVQARPDPGRWQGWWEFPGGGVEAGESWEDCARREAREEVGLEVRVLEQLDEVRWSPSGHGGVHVVFLLCSCDDGAQTSANLGQRLEWLGADELRERRFLPANAEVLELLAERLA